MEWTVVLGGCTHRWYQVVKVGQLKQRENRGSRIQALLQSSKWSPPAYAGATLPPAKSIYPKISKQRYEWISNSKRSIQIEGLPWTQDDATQIQHDRKENQQENIQIILVR